MSKEIEPNRFSCHRENTLNRIASGFDSVVFRYGDYALKVYDKERKSQKLREYMKVTNLACDLTIKENYHIKIPPKNIEFPFRVNPFLKIYECNDCGCLYGVAPFVPGKRLDQKYPDELGDEFLIPLGVASVYLQHELGVSGIEILMCNVKVLKNEELVVTDLCGVIENLRRKKRR